MIVIEVEAKLGEMIESALGRAFAIYAEKSAHGQEVEVQMAFKGFLILIGAGSTYEGHLATFNVVNNKVPHVEMAIIGP